MNHFDILIVGVGASGILCAHHLSKSNSALTALLIDPSESPGGTAYGKSSPSCLLNVPHWGMSALVEDPSSFSSFVTRHNLPLVDEAFARRQDYQKYLSSILANALKNPRLRFERSALQSIADKSSHWIACCRNSSGESITFKARAIILALGNEAPSPIRLEVPSGARIENNPWTTGTLNRLLDAQKVYILGSRLTALDQVAELVAHGFKGEIHLISRHGNLPIAHDLGPALSGEFLDTVTPLRALRLVRSMSREHPWRSVVDGLRPHTNLLWRSWTEKQKRQFLRHARSVWDVHRHRVAPSLHALVDELRARGRLFVRRGKFSRGTLRSMDGHEIITSSSDSVLVNCTGPAAITSNPLVQSLLEQRYLLQGEGHQGIQSLMPDSFKLSGEYSESIGLYGLGPVLRGDLWETTAMPEIRQQAPALIDEIVTRTTEVWQRSPAANHLRSFPT